MFLQVKKAHHSKAIENGFRLDTKSWNNLWVVKEHTALFSPFLLLKTKVKVINNL